ncbi:MAG: hypothetical protein RMZ69_33545, partial [Nostoc sp. ChiQUE01a]|nr:hypothetical protein [Nostoc sp. ChiQUE01a]
KKGEVNFYASKLTVTISNPDYYVFTQISKFCLKALNSLALKFSDKSNDVRCIIIINIDIFLAESLKNSERN